MRGGQGGGPYGSGRAWSVYTEARTGLGNWPVDSVGDGAVDDAGGVAWSKSGGGSGVNELTGNVVLISAGPLEESAGVVGESGQGAFAAVGEGGELDGAAANDGGEVGGRARPAGRRWRRADGLPWCGGGAADDFVGEPCGHAAGVSGVAAADRVGAGGGGRAGGDAVGPAGFEVDLPGQPVAAVGVAERLPQVGGWRPVPQVHPVGGGGGGDRLVLWPGGPGAGAAAEPGQQGQAVTAVPEPARVIPFLARDGLGGQVDAGQQAGGRGRAAVGVDVDQDQPGGPGDPGQGLSSKRCNSRLCCYLRPALRRPSKTSDAVKLSSCVAGLAGRGGEGGGFVVVLAGDQAVVQAA